MTPARLDELIAIYRDGLLNDTVPFWMRNAPDRQCGGFASYLDADGSVVSYDKSVWVQGRFTWLLSRLYNDVEKRQGWLDLARFGADFILKHAFDADGRCFFRVTRDGRGLIKRRYLFSEMFVIIALAELSQALSDADPAESHRLRDKAEEVYRRALMYHTTPGLLPPKTMPGVRPAKSHAMPMILLATTQVLRRTGDSPLYQHVIDRAIFEVTHHFLRRDERVLLETVGPNGERIDAPEGRLCNPGHAIETAWFLMEEARHRRDKALLQDALTILDWSLDIGWDKAFGGILYFVDIEGKPPEPYEHDMKLWWPHNEAIYATLLAFHLTRKPQYLEWHKRLHDWSYAHFPDRQNGEWFGYLHRDGTLSSTVKGNYWKGPFHLPRMQLYCWKLLEQMKAGEAGAERW